MEEKKIEKIRVGYFLPKQTSKKIKMQALKEETSASELIDRIFNNYLEGKQKEAMQKWS